MNGKDCCAAYYEKAANDYDSRRFSFECRKIVDSTFKRYVFAEIKEKTKILDVGTGMGRFARYFAQNGKQVIAIDISCAMLEKAREKSRQEQVEQNIKFIRGDIEAIPLKDNLVDAISCIHVLVHYKNIDKAISEFARVLKPQGDLIFEVANSWIADGYNKLRKLFTGGDVTATLIIIINLKMWREY